MAGTDITGTYKFISLQAKTSSTVQSISSSYNARTITTSEYTTINNSGTVTIDANRMISNNLSYSINSMAKSTLYENGVLIDTFSFPFQVTIPSVSGAGTYKRISSDSLYFDSGTVLIGGSASTPQPAGAKIKFENGRLLIYSSTSQSNIITDQGETVVTLATGSVITTLQKQ